MSSEELTPWERAFDEVLRAIEGGVISDFHRDRLEFALARPRGRPRAKIGLGQYEKRAATVLTMRRLMKDGVRYEDAAYEAAQAHSVGTPDNPGQETVIGWEKRDGRREAADAKLRKEAGEVRVGDLLRSQRGYIRALLTEADRLGIAHTPDWPISRIKKAIRNATDTK